MSFRCEAKAGENKGKIKIPPANSLAVDISARFITARSVNDLRVGCNGNTGKREADMLQNTHTAAARSRVCCVRHLSVNECTEECVGGAATLFASRPTARGHDLIWYAYVRRQGKVATMSGNSGLGDERTKKV